MEIFLLLFLFKYHCGKRQVLPNTWWIHHIINTTSLSRTLSLVVSWRKRFISNLSESAVKGISSELYLHTHDPELNALPQWKDGIWNINWPLLEQIIFVYLPTDFFFLICLGFLLVLWGFFLFGYLFVVFFVCFFF